eukprot:jgi/Psemu1/12160/gm1.12160_g
MTQTAVSWNEVRGIHFSFGPNFTAGNRQGDLNAVFSWILPNISSLLIVDDDGVETLRPDPIPVLKSLIVAAIMDALPPSEVSKAHKRHISSLIAKTTIFWHSKAIAGRIRVRDKQALDIAAEHAKRGRPIIQLVLNIIHWKFHSEWYPYEFHKVYDAADGIPLDKTGSSQILLTHYLQTVFGKDKTTDTLPPKRKHHTKPTAPVVSETLPVPSHPTILPSGTTALVHTKPTVSNPIKTPSNSTAPNASRYTWTWTYSPNSDSVSFHLVQSDFDKSPPVTAPSVTPSALTRSGHHSAPPQESANFRWKFNPPNETVVFYRLPKPAPVLSLQAPVTGNTAHIHLLFVTRLTRIQTKLSSASPKDIAMLSRSRYLPFLSTCAILHGFDIGSYDLFGQVASIPVNAIGSGSGGLVAFTPPNYLPCRVQTMNPLPPIICGFVSPILADTTIFGSGGVTAFLFLMILQLITQPNSPYDEQLHDVYSMMDDILSLTQMTLDHPLTSQARIPKPENPKSKSTINPLITIDNSSSLNTSPLQSPQGSKSSAVPAQPTQGYKSIFCLSQPFPPSTIPD